MEESSKRLRTQIKTTIKVSKETKGELKEYKNTHGLASMDLVMRSLLEAASADIEAVRAANGDRSPVNEQIDDDGEVPVRQILYASEVIKNEEVVQYHTGLRRGAYLWLQKLMVDAVRFSTFFENGSSKTKRRFRKQCVPLFDFLIPVLSL
jgi:hypothetical protein